VRAYGERLMAENDEDSLYFEYGMQMVFGANYTAADKEMFGGYLCRGEGKSRTVSFRLFCAHLKKTPAEDLPMYLLDWVWEECSVRCAHREQLVRALIEGGCMPEEIREDVRHDKLPYIRRLADTEEE